MSKKIIGLALAFAAVAAITAGPASAKTDKQVIAVLYFQTEGANSYLGPVVGKYMMAALTYLGKYKVVEPEKVEKIAEGYNLKEGAAVSNEDALGMAKKLGATVACKGKVTKSGGTYTVTAEFIHVATGAVVTTKSAKVNSEADLSKAVDRIVGLTS
jgi:TolB-like protein